MPAPVSTHSGGGTASAFKNQAAIRAALRKITNSPIVALQPYDPVAPKQLHFYTADDKIYGAEKAGGKWQISEAVLVY